jgi:hypothetical protein
MAERGGVLMLVLRGLPPVGRYHRATKHSLPAYLANPLWAALLPGCRLLLLQAPQPQPV